MANYFYTDGNGQKQGTTTGLLTLALAMLSLSAVVGCGKSGSSALVGIWQIEEGQETRDVPEDLELLKDGTGIIDNMGVTWKTERGRLYLTASLGAIAYNYKISRKTLTLTDSDGRNITYKQGSARSSSARSNRLSREQTDAFAYVKLLANAVDQYAMQAGQPPTTEQGLWALVSKPPELPDGKWAGPYIESNATSRDPWGNDYLYISPGRDGRSFDIWSCGPDRIDGTEDDIGSWLGSLD